MGSAVSVILTQDRAIRAFRDAGATSPQSARRFEELGLKPTWVKRRFIAAGVLIEAAPDTYYLDEQGVTRFAARRRIIAAVVLAIGLLLIAVAPKAAPICLVAGVFGLVRGRP